MKKNNVIISNKGVRSIETIRVGQKVFIESIKKEGFFLGEIANTLGESIKITPAVMINDNNKQKIVFTKMNDISSQMQLS